MSSIDKKILRNGEFVFKKSFISKKIVLKDGCFRIYSLEYSKSKTLYLFLPTFHGSIGKQSQGF
jgi:hypothetical protein